MKKETLEKWLDIKPWTNGPPHLGACPGCESVYDLNVDEEGLCKECGCEPIMLGINGKPTFINRKVDPNLIDDIQKRPEVLSIIIEARLAALNECWGLATGGREIAMEGITELANEVKRARVKLDEKAERA